MWRKFAFVTTIFALLMLFTARDGSTLFASDSSSSFQLAAVDPLKSLAINSPEPLVNFPEPLAVSLSEPLNTVAAASATPSSVATSSTSLTPATPAASLTPAATAAPATPATSLTPAAPAILDVTPEIESISAPVQVTSAAFPPTSLVMEHTAWQRLDILSPDFPFAWARRYLELKSIAEDVDVYSKQLPSQVQRLREVITVAQKDVVALLLDLVPAKSNVQEITYIVGMLNNWNWRSETPLRRTASIDLGIEHSLGVLANIGQAVEEMQANTKKRPIMEKVSQDFYDLYKLVLRNMETLHEELHTTRITALGLYEQIDKATGSVESQLPSRWVSYYTTPLMISSASFSRLGVDFLTMAENWSYEESYPNSVPFAIALNIIILFSIVLAHVVIARVVAAPVPKIESHIFIQSLCKKIHTLDIKYRLTFDFCFLIMVNSVIDALPQFHEGIPFLFVPQIFMAMALAVWMRTSEADPQVWELVLPVTVGLSLLHGDAGALLMLLGMGGALLLPLCSMLFKQQNKGQSVLRIAWFAALTLGLLLTIMGLGRLTVPLLMVFMVVRASASMLSVINNSPELLPHTMGRAWLVPVFAVFLCVMSISFLVACPGFGMLRNYWYINAVPIMGFNVTFGDTILAILFFLGVVFVSNISRQILENLGRDSRVLDASAVPVLHVVINCILLSIFALFVMSSLGVDVTSLAFIGGGVSIGVGFAAKTILSNFFCGMVIICSKVVRAGDIVEINGILGKVLSVNMRATVVETIKNGILLVPNEEMLDSRLTNWSFNNLHVREDIDVSVVVKSSIEATVAALEDAAKAVSGVLKSPAPKALFTGFSDNSIDFVLKVWIKDVRNRIETMSEVRKVLCHTLEERGVLLSALGSKRLDVCMLDDATALSGSRAKPAQSKDGETLDALDVKTNPMV